MGSYIYSIPFFPLSVQYCAFVPGPESKYLHVSVNGIKLFIFYLM